MSPDPLLCAALRGELVPGDTVVALAQRHRVDRLLLGARLPTARRDILLDQLAVRELQVVLSALEGEGIEPIVFKGAALAHTHYAESWLRPRLDADLLIAPDRRAAAFDVLRRLGYSQPPTISGDLISYQTMFVRAHPIGVEHVLDVHWKIGNPQAIAHALTYDDLLSRAERVAVPDGSMRVVSPVDALLIACIHRVAHHHDTDDLIWVYDIHLIAGRLTVDEWRRFVDLAVDRQVSQLCGRGLQLAVDCFHTDISNDVRDRLSGKSEASAIYLRRDLRGVDRLAADLRALGPRRAPRLLKEHLFPPVSYIKQKYGVRHPALVPAFYAYRIVAGAAGWLRRPS
ncbi:MAG TPA: nucleotidyltransferase family protein [Vicinamibacterales bacterium]